jgi:hypothetical protein
MQLIIDEKRWLGKQSFFVQMIVLAMIFFGAGIIGALVADYMFDAPAFFQRSAKEILKFFGLRLTSALILSAIIVFFIRRNRKKSSR